MSTSKQPKTPRRSSPSARNRRQPPGKGRSGHASNALDRPFASDVLARAEAAVADYQFVLRQEGGEWFGNGLEMPEAVGDGKDVAACVRSIRSAMVSVAAYMIEQGQEPPPAAREGVRTEQINVRLSASERLALDTKARQHGHKGISDFVRSSLLS